MTYSDNSEVNDFLDDWLDEYLLYVKYYLYDKSTDMKKYFYTLSKEWFNNWEFYHSRDYRGKTLLVRNVKIRDFSSLRDTVRADLVDNFGEEEVSEMSENEIENYLWNYIDFASKDIYDDLNSISERNLGESLIVVGSSGGYWGYNLDGKELEIDTFFELSDSMKRAAVTYLVSEAEKNYEDPNVRIGLDVESEAYDFVESIFSDKSVTDDSLVPSDGFKEVITYLDSLMEAYQ